jgi:DNA-binding MarR family transcriptional regulator
LYKEKDVNKLPVTAKKIRIIRYLTPGMAKSLVQRFPNLKSVILTQGAKRKTNRKAINYLFRKKIDVVYDYARQGRPIKFSRRDLARMIIMRRKGNTYEEIAHKIGVSKSSVMRALRRITKFTRWREDYENKEKIVWMVTRDADPDARRLADNHYSRKTPGSKFFCGPGEKLVLITPDKKALFVWRKNKIRWDNQKGVECALFRNEGAGLSSTLIKEAMKIARKKWPKERFFTYVWPSKLRSKEPGFCFIKAGWKIMGRNKCGRRKLLILEAPK